METMALWTSQVFKLRAPFRNRRLRLSYLRLAHPAWRPGTCSCPAPYPRRRPFAPL